MPGRLKGDFPAWQGREGLALRHGLDQRQAVQRVLAGVQRQGRRVFGKAVAVGECRVFFLQVAAVGQQNRAQVARARAGIHRAMKAALGQQRQVAAVVQVRVREQHGVDVARRHRQRTAVAQAQLLVALKQAAVHQHVDALVAYQKFGAGDRVRAAQKADLHAHSAPCRQTRPATGHKKSRQVLYRPGGLAAQRYCARPWPGSTKKALELVFPAIARRRMLAAAFFERIF